MNAKVRRRIEMGIRALGFSQAHPHEDQGYIALQTRLERLLSEAEALDFRQRDGLIAVRTGARRKVELRRMMKRCHLAYLARLGEAIVEHDPELAQKLAPDRSSRAYMMFRSSAEAIVREAIRRKEFLQRHGLAGSVLEELVQLLAEFDWAVKELTDGRRTHVGASAGLLQIGHEILRTVRLMDGFNRVRFAGDAGARAEWAGASKVLAFSAKRADQPGPDGGVGDAAA